MFFRSNSDMSQSEKPFGERQFIMPRLDDLRKLEAYRVGFGQNAGPIIIGRGELWKQHMQQEISQGEKKWNEYQAALTSGKQVEWNYQCKTSYIPEASHSKYDRNGNLAFILGGIESRRPFELLNSLDEICESAKIGLQELREQVRKSGEAEATWRGLGGCFPELQWILSGNYTLTLNNRIIAKPNGTSPILLAEDAIPHVMQKMFDMSITEVAKRIEQLENISHNLKHEATLIQEVESLRLRP